MIENLCFLCVFPGPHVSRKLLVYSSIYHELFVTLEGRRLCFSAKNPAF